MLSKSGKNYISLLLKAVPAAAALTAIGCMMLKNLFTFQSIPDDWWSLYAFIPVPFIEVYVCAALFIGLTAAVIVVLKKQNKKEIL